MNNFDKLIEHFEKFPGIGARQAKRFVFHILTLPKAESEDLAELIGSIADSMAECVSCRRFFSRTGESGLCNICDSQSRDRSKLMVVERDSDVTAIERSGIYNGLYFVLGGTAPLLESKENNRLRGNGLKKVVTDRLDAINEIILAFSVNPDGENTARYVESVLKETLEGSAVAVTHLGRGLSTGSELEYADPDTIKSALENRH